MKNIRNILAKGVFMLLVSLLAMACTEKSDWGIDASYSRPFGTNEDGINVTKDEKVARVTVTWDAMPGVEYYILEISKNELTDEIPMGSEENGNLVYGNTVENRILKAPFLIDNLEAGAEYYLRIKSVANGKESYWAYLDEPFKTVTEEDVLNVPAEEDLPVASGKVRMSWEAGLTVTHFEIVGGAAPIERAITAEEAAAGEAWIEGLKIFTAYTISIYNNETLRGSQEVVVPGLPATAMAVLTRQAEAPISIASAAWLGAPIPASTTTGTFACSMIIRRKSRVCNPLFVPIGAPSGMTVAAPASSRRLQSVGSAWQ